MRYNVTFNQLALVKYNNSIPEKFQLSIKDAIILQQLYHLSNWEQVETRKYKGEDYFWVAYGKIINELPALDINTVDGLSRRIKKKLIIPGLIKLFVDRQDNSKTYWRFTNKGLKVGTPGRMEGYPGMNGRETPGRTEGRPPDERPDNYNTIDNKTNDKREALSHFDFLKSKYSEKIDELKKENTVNNWSNLIRKFNLKSFKDKPSIKDFEKYIISWIENENYNNQNEPEIINQPAYRRIIS
ncbi:hypothetical protein [Christiangramia sp. SM2212]|uniref:Uncharacterized protein n=1 Tax=Christiangramia sediminicola TaxID=3073267 RepID=A0ABU1ES33_9FLAO|nr:hypothetical protein [Christiangramia sp. SM2212]MDR5591207.1 hypothetical protein [Christiangramia sp. SM2212]